MNGKRESFQFEGLQDPFEVCGGKTETQSSEEAPPRKLPPGAVGLPGLGGMPPRKLPPGAVGLPGMGEGAKKPPPGAVGLPGLGGFNPADIKSQLKKTGGPNLGPSPPKPEEGSVPLNPPLRKTLNRASTTGSVASEYQRGKEELFKWCKKCTEPYGIPMDNFTTSWADGMAFCALVHHNRPGTIDFNSLNKENKNANLKIAL